MNVLLKLSGCFSFAGVRDLLLLGAIAGDYAPSSETFAHSIAHFSVFLLPLLLLVTGVFMILLRRQVRRKTEALSQSNREWQKTFDATPDMIAIINRDSKIERINAAMANRLGVRPEAVIGKACHDVVHQEACAFESCPHQRLLNDGNAHTEEVYEERLGGHCEVTTSPLKNAGGEISGCVHVVRDINEQKKVESLLAQRVVERTAEVHRKSEDLADTERKYRIVADFTYDWEYWERPDGSMAYVSPSCKYITGYSSDEFIQCPGLLDEIVDSEDRDAWMAHRKGRSRERKSQSFRFRIRMKKGESRWLEHACQPVEEDGEFLGYRVSNRDITERQDASAERNALRSQIAHIARVNAMGELTAALAHEINQPLGAILNNAQAASRFLEQDSPDLDEVREALEDIASDDKRAGEIVRRLRRMVRADTPDYEPTRMRDVINEVISLIQSELVLKQVRLHTHMMKQVMEIDCDRVQIQQVLLNLITNAIESMKDVPREDRELMIRMKRNDDHHVTVSVKDHGSGMSAESIDSVFQPFYTTKDSGMGMGLAISRTIIELHKGTLWAEPNSDKGMTFGFTIPCERSLE